MTLLEMLVVMAVMSFVAVVVSQALDQIGRVERILQGTQLEAALESVQAAWLAESLESLLPAEADSPLRFKGSAKQIRGLTTAPLSDTPAGVAQMQMTLVYVDSTGKTQVRVQLDTPRETPNPLPATRDNFRVAAEWPGNVGRFQFMDATGQWHDQWPLDERNARLLPVAVMVDTGMAHVPSFIVSMGASAIGPPSRKTIGTL